MMNTALASVVGFLVHEVIVVRMAVKQSEATPDKFSFRYYFSKTSNWLNIILNALCTFGLMLCLEEIMKVEVFLLSKLPGWTMQDEGYPAMTAMLIGIIAAWIVKSGLAAIGRKAPHVPMDTP